MTTPVPQVTATGISAPSYQAWWEYITALVQSIYGSDIYIDPDSQDGQFLAIFCAAMTDTGQQAVGVYNQLSPTTSEGTGLSSVVKINGLARLVPSNSTADVTLIGQAGTLIVNGLIGDNQQLGTQWALPASVTIPISGAVVVTATCTQFGAVSALAGTLVQILTPTLGWQTVTNAADATVGAPVESDATLRQRQSVSTSLPAVSPVASVNGALANLPGVQRLFVYENDNGYPDANGIPGHSIAVVIQGGDAQTIASTIALKKTPGTGTYGNISELVIDPITLAPITINFFNLTVVNITVNITIKALQGYVSTTGAQLIADVVGWINSQPIGEDIYWSKLFGPAGLNNVVLGNTFNVTSITVARDSNPPAAADVVIAFNEATISNTSLVTLTVT